MNSLEKLFAKKLTENGDVSFSTTGNNLLDILFATSYFERNLERVKIGNSEKEKLFAMFIRDGRFGIGRRDLGRELLKQAEASAEDIVLSGRYDDLYHIPTNENLEFLKNEIYSNNELAKKWAPRLTCKDKEIAKELCKMWNIEEKEYRKLIKLDSVETKLTTKRVDEIEFDKVPSLALLKYYKRFLQEERFRDYLESVKKGERKLNIATTTVYDIYKNRESIDADLFFEKLEKIKISCVPVLDTSGSMFDNADSIGKATCIAHYLSKCSTFCNGYVVSFSSEPQLLKITTAPKKILGRYYNTFGNANNYCKELNSLYTGDCSNTDFAATIKLFQKMDELPEYLVVLSDMEFDYGSNTTKNETMHYFKKNNIKTKIVWWNFNARNKTMPEIDEYGNIFFSGYSPYLLKFLDSAFNATMFLDNLLLEYAKNIKRENYISLMQNIVETYKKEKNENTLKEEPSPKPQNLLSKQPKLQKQKLLNNKN